MQLAYVWGGTDNGMTLPGCWIDGKIFVGLVDILADTFQVDDSDGLWLGWDDEDVGLGCRSIR